MTKFCWKIPHKFRVALGHCRSILISMDFAALIAPRRIGQRFCWRWLGAKQLHGAFAAWLQAFAKMPQIALSLRFFSFWILKFRTTKLSKSSQPFAFATSLLLVGSVSYCHVYYLWRNIITQFNNSTTKYHISLITTSQWAVTAVVWQCIVGYMNNFYCCYYYSDYIDYYALCMIVAKLDVSRKTAAVISCACFPACKCLESRIFVYPAATFQSLACLFIFTASNGMQRDNKLCSSKMMLQLAA